MALRTFYRIVFIRTPSLIGIMLAFCIVAVLCGFDTSNAIETWPLAVWILPCLIGSFFAIGITVAWLGMILDCAFTSNLPIWSKGLWLVLLVFTSIIGALIYYFCVYKNRPIQSVLAEAIPPMQA
ncbi:hypothetical protein [Terracidiphilus gabretensis]|uniref:hypothetical protein n=1 Tax=Terracidiphilus gabretensis TaxID=1577687 RepID=UPI00071BD0E4|nr:hypothetical protein [Terracidiphilus gabretensis]